MRDKIIFKDLPNEDQHKIREYIYLKTHRAEIPYPEGLSEKGNLYLEKFYGGKEGKGRNYNRADFIEVLNDTEINTRMVQDKLKEYDPQYIGIDYSHVKRTLQKLKTAGLINGRIDPNSGFWIWKKKGDN